jgi:hypothetical protein
MAIGWGLITGTVLLVILGCALWWSGLLGCAQLLFVLASGTAGAGLVMILDGSRQQEDEEL